MTNITLPRSVVEQALNALHLGISMYPNGGTAAVTIQATIDALRAALEQPQDHPEQHLNMVPAGWKLVPVEPTIPMLHRADGLTCIDFVALGEEGAFDLDELKEIYRAMLAAAPQPFESEPVRHDEDLLEKLYWEMDHQRSKTGDERLAFKGKMRFYASEFRARSLGRMAYAPSVTDDMMNLADRLGSEFDNVDPMAWKHLLVYAPKPPRQPLTEEEIAYCIFEARLGAEGAFKRNGSSSYRIARAIERAHEIGGKA